MLVYAVSYFINFCSFLYYILSSELIGFTLLFFLIAYSCIHIEDYEFSSKYCCFCCWVANSCLTLWIPTDRSMPGFPVPHHHSEFAQVHNHGVGDAIQPSHPLLPSSASASVFHSIWVFSNELAVHTRWPKYWSFSFSISPSNEYSELISFRIDWLDLLSVQGTLKNLLQQHSSKASTLQRSAFFYSPILTSIHDYWKNHSLD